MIGKRQTLFSQHLLVSVLFDVLY